MPTRPALPGRAPSRTRSLPGSAVALLLLAACQPAADAPAASADPATPQTAVAAASDPGFVIGCVRADTPRAAPDSVMDADLRGARLRCVLRPGRPAVDVAFAATDEGYPSRVEVPLPDGSKQTLDIPAETRPNRYTPLLEAIDYDNDGWADLRAQAWAGATGNTGYHVWMYDPAAGRFARSAVLSDSVMNPTPKAGWGTDQTCVEGYSTGGHAGQIYGEAVWCLRDGRWREVHRETQSHLVDQRYLRERWEEGPNDTLVVRYRDTVIVQRL